MPKLDTTINNLERKSNKVSSSDIPSANWTDEQYPSAKTLYNTYNHLLDLMHPIGSTLITNTNLNPANFFGGEWTLIDKSFKNAYFPFKTSHWVSTNASLNDPSNILLSNHTITLLLNFKINKSFSNTIIELGKLDLSFYGINQLSCSSFYGTSVAESNNSVITYRIDQDGTISITNILTANDEVLLPSELNFFIHLTLPTIYNDMLDDFCDKFFWKRSA